MVQTKHHQLSLLRTSSGPKRTTSVPSWYRGPRTQLPPPGLCPLTVPPPLSISALRTRLPAQSPWLIQFNHIKPERRMVGAGSRVTSTPSFQTQICRSWGHPQTVPAFQPCGVSSPGEGWDQALSGPGKRVNPTLFCSTLPSQGHPEFSVCAVCSSGKLIHMRESQKMPVDGKHITGDKEQVTTFHPPHHTGW